MSDKTVDQPKQTAPEKKGRSPSYPALTLQECLKLAKILWDKEGRHAAAVPTVAQHFDYSAKSSGGLLAVAALKKFGLVIEEGSKEKRTIKLSPRALTLLNPGTTEEARAPLIKEAALLPEIHRELWEKYKLPLPSAQTIVGFLTFDRHFTKAAADAVVSEYKETLSFARLMASDSIPDKGSVEPDSETETEEQSSAKPKDQSEEKQMSTASQEPPAASQARGRHFASTPKGSRAFNFPLPTGMAGLTVPFPLTESDFQSLISTLQNFKEGLVKKEIATVDTCDADYEKQVIALAETGNDFDVSNFKFSFDFEFLAGIAKKHDFNLKFNVATESAFLRKNTLATRSFPAKAVWKNKDFDKPVVIVKEAGKHGNLTYYQSEDGTGIPANELIFEK